MSPSLKKLSTVNFQFKEVFGNSKNLPQQVFEGKSSGVNPQNGIPGFSLHFPKELSYTATLGLKEMGQFFWESREESLPSWLSQFSFAKLRQPTGQIFPKEFSHFLQT